MKLERHMPSICSGTSGIPPKGQKAKKPLGQQAPPHVQYQPGIPKKHRPTPRGAFAVWPKNVVVLPLPARRPSSAAVFRTVLRSTTTDIWLRQGPRPLFRPHPPGLLQAGGQAILNPPQGGRKGGGSCLECGVRSNTQMAISRSKSNPLAVVWDIYWQKSPSQGWQTKRGSA